jgi:hypothetical protein
VQAYQRSESHERPGPAGSRNGRRFNHSSRSDGSQLPVLSCQDTEFPRDVLMPVAFLTALMPSATR